MPDEIKELQKKVDALEQQLRLYENDSIYRGYYVLNKVVNEQIDILKSMNLASEIGLNPKEDKKYDRIKAIWEGLKGMITDLNTLKVDLKITGDEHRDSKKVPFNDRIAENRS
jgi:hypothetical protein